MQPKPEYVNLMVYSERIIKSVRKERKCIWCDEMILAAQSAVDVFCKEEGFDVTSGAMHPECAKAWNENDWDACDYLFDPGSYNRGCCCERGRCQCGKGEA